MADEQILSREGVGEISARLLQFGQCIDRESLLQCDAALRAQVAAMAEWAAKVKHERDCSSVNNCGCMNRRRNCDYCAEFVKGDCDCILADLPADLIARGRELLAGVEELKRLKGER